MTRELLVFTDYFEYVGTLDGDIAICGTVACEEDPEQVADMPERCLRDPALYYRYRGTFHTRAGTCNGPLVPGLTYRFRARAGVFCGPTMGSILDLRPIEVMILRVSRSVLSDVLSGEFKSVDEPSPAGRRRSGQGA